MQIESVGLQMIEGLHGFLSTASLGIGSLVLIGLVLFSRGFRNRPAADRDQESAHSLVAEYAWGVVPFVLFAAVVVWGLR
ncbi:MAG: hypothetical protein KDD43_12910 [Bdellovibrionales bacterium]|nr:hypothetical protein [Bdellovibrionales bacterium]